MTIALKFYNRTNNNNNKFIDFILKLNKFSFKKPFI